MTGVGDDGTIDTSPDAAITFTYYVGAGTGGANLGASAPKDVGTYTVVAHYSGSSNYSSADSSPLTFNITVALPTVTAVDAGGVYTSNPFPASATVTGVGIDGTIASSPNAAITFTYFVGAGTGGTNLGASAPKDVGTYTVVAHYSGSSNYSSADSSPVTFSITVALPTVTAVDAGGVYTSNPFPASATVTGVGIDGTIASSPNAAITFTYYVGVGLGGTNLGATAPKLVGTYTAVAHYSGSSNYSSADSGPVTFSITVATPAVTAADAGGVYTSNAFPASATVTGVGSDGTIASSPNAAITFTYYVGSGTGGTNLGATAPKNVGTYTVVAHYSGSSNYSSADSSPMTFSITVATPTVTAVDAGGVYTSNPFPASATVTGVGSDGTIASSPNAAITFTYYVGVGTGGTNLGAAAPKNVGTYTVVAHFSGSSNYSSANSNPVTFSITVATPTMTALDAGGVYTSNKFPASATVTGVGSDGTIASSPNAAITFTYYVGTGTGGTNLGATAPKNVGAYTVVAHYSGSSNYSSADSSPVTFSITVATPTVTAVDAGGVYTGNAFPASASVTGVGGDGTIASSPSAAITFTYYVGAGTGGTNLGAAASKNAGTYTVVAHYSGSSNYSSANSSPVTFNVAKAPLTVTANNLFKAPNKPNPTLTSAIAGFVPGETLGTSGVTGAPGLSTTAVTTSPPGVYPITVTLGTLAATNYSFTLVNGTLTVDGTAPTSTVNPLPLYETSTTFNVSWTGTDNTGGSGIAFFDVYVSDNGGPFTKFVSASTGTSTSFTGVALHTYGFFSIATDNVGNVQATPASAQATTRIAGTDTWSGASTTSANWTDPNNWVGGIAPGTDDTLVFPSSAVQKSDIDNFAAGMLFNAINLTGGGYSITGNSIILATGLNNSGSTANTFNPNVVLTAAQTWSNTGSTFNVAGNVTNQGFLLTISTASSTVLTGSIQGSGGLTSGGAGTLTLGGSASNTYSGATTVNAGALNLSKSNPATAIAGPLVIGDGVGGLNADLVNIIFDNQIADTAPITINSSGQLNFGTSSDTIGDLTLNGGSVNVSGVSGAIGLAGNITANQSSSITQRLNLVGALATHTVTVASGATLTLTGQISGAGIGLTKAGPGALTLNGSTENLYTGTTTVNAGTLNLSKTSGATAIAGPLVVGDGVDVATVNYTGSNQVGDAQPVTVNANGAVNMQGFSDEIGGLNFSGGTLAIGAGGTLTINGDIIATAGASSITGGTLYIKEVSRNVSVASGATLTVGSSITSIFGAGITKTGTGTLVLTGANTFTGATAVSAGTLKLAAGSLAGPVSVAAGATLTGSGATGALTFASSSAFTANIASSGGNQVNATGDVNLNGATLNIALGALPAAGQTFTILTSTTKIIGTFAGFANNQLVMTGGHLYRVTYNLTSVVLTFVS